MKHVKSILTDLGLCKIKYDGLAYVLEKPDGTDYEAYFTSQDNAEEFIRRNYNVTCNCHPRIQYHADQKEDIVEVPIHELKQRITSMRKNLDLAIERISSCKKAKTLPSWVWDELYFIERCIKTAIDGVERTEK